MRLRAFGIRCVKRGRRAPEARRLAADFVERRQPNVTVERRIFERFRGDRSRILLEAHREAQHFPAVVARAGLIDELRAQRIADEIEHGVVGEFAAHARGRNGCIDDLHVFVSDDVVGHVRAVDGEHRDDLDQRAAQPEAREIARAAV